MAYTAEELLGLIREEFESSRKLHAPVFKVLEKIKEKAASYEDAADYADAIGEICSEAFRKFCTGEYLGAEYVGQEIADGTIPPMLRESHALVSDVTESIQTLLNQQAGLGIKAQTAGFNAEAAQNLANKVVNVSRAEGLERAQWVLDEPVKTFSRMVVDDTLRANVDFQARAGLRPMIQRKLVGGCCEWCASLAGTYDYGKEPRPDFYRRHERCRCIVEYLPGNGRRQNAHTKAWSEPEEALELRKTVGLTQKPKMLSDRVEDVTSEYVKSARPGHGHITVEPGVDPDDVKTAEWLKAQFGGDIKLLKAINKQRMGTADSIWNDEVWEFKRPTSKNAIDKRYQKAIHQLEDTALRLGMSASKRGVVLDVTGVDVGRVAAVATAVDVARQRSHTDTDIIIRYGNEVAKVIRVHTKKV